MDVALLRLGFQCTVGVDGVGGMNDAGDVAIGNQPDRRSGRADFGNQVLVARAFKVLPVSEGVCRVADRTLRTTNR